MVTFSKEKTFHLALLFFYKNEKRHNFCGTKYTEYYAIKDEHLPKSLILRLLFIYKLLVCIAIGPVGNWEGVLAIVLDRQLLTADKKKMFNEQTAL